MSGMNDCVQSTSPLVKAMLALSLPEKASIWMPAICCFVGLPVVGVLAQLVRLALELLDLGVRAGADRVRVGELRRVLHLGPDVLRQDVVAADLVEGGREGLVEGELHRVGVDRGDLVEVVEAAQHLLLELEGVDDVVGGERLAVRPLDAVAQREGEGLAVLGLLPLGREPRRVLGIRHAVHRQRLVDRLQGHGGGLRGERVEVARERRQILARDGEQLVAGGVTGAGGARATRTGGQDQGRGGGRGDRSQDGSRPP